MVDLVYAADARQGLVSMMPTETKDWIAIYAAGLSTLNAIGGAWAIIRRNKIRLASSYSFSGQDGIEDHITVVNLSERPLQIS